MRTLNNISYIYCTTGRQFHLIFVNYGNFQLIMIDESLETFFFVFYRFRIY